MAANMKRIAYLAAILLALLAAGCGNTVTSQPAPTVTVTATPVEQESGLDPAEKAFLSDAVDLEEMITRHAEFFSDGDLYSETTIEYLKEGMAAWNECWCEYDCPSERFFEVWRLTCRLSSKWYDVCEGIAGLALGEVSEDEVVGLVEEASAVQYELVDALGETAEGAGVEL
jgi:hypothetical protein